jgi:hypothetical protein
MNDQESAGKQRSAVVWGAGSLLVGILIFVAATWLRRPRPPEVQRSGERLPELAQRWRDTMEELRREAQQQPASDPEPP